MTQCESNFPDVFENWSEPKNLIERFGAATKTLQDHVKATIAPYKYPRTIEYVAQLPRTQTGKLQRFELRRMAADTASHKLAS